MHFVKEHPDTGGSNVTRESPPPPSLVLLPGADSNSFFLRLFWKKSMRAQKQTRQSFTTHTQGVLSCIFPFPHLVSQTLFLGSTQKDSELSSPSV